MSNRIIIETYESKKTRGEEKCIEVDVSDSYSGGRVSIGLKENIGDLGVDLEDDLSILQYCWLKISSADEDIDSQSIAKLIDYIVEDEKGVTINGTFYDWSEIKHIFEENPDQ